MRVVVIGGSGHIGTYLVPRLVRAGHEVVSISRGSRQAYTAAPEWEQVHLVTADRQAEDAAGTFGARIASLNADVVIDLVCFTLASAQALVAALRGQSAHLVVCGSIWRSGPSHLVPITEETSTPPFSQYGIQKDLIARMLTEEDAAGTLATTSVHPGHIVGPGWDPINPLGNIDPSVWTKLSGGEPLALPTLGAETLAHVHADDVAQVFELAAAHREQAAGQEFYATADTALTLRGYAHQAAGWFGQRAWLEHVSWDQFRAGTSTQFAEHSWEHIVRSHHMSVDKAKTLLGYAPAHSPLEAVLESLRWLIEHDKVTVARSLAV